MKTALILFKYATDCIDAQYVGDVINTFTQGKIHVDSLDVIADGDDIEFNRLLLWHRETADNLIVIGENVAFDINDCIATAFESDLTENENALKAIKELGEKRGIDYPVSFALIPEKATLIKNEFSAFQGYLLEENDFTLVMLPSNISAIKKCYSGYIRPYFKAKYNDDFNKTILKFFGDENALKSLLLKQKEECNGFDYRLTTAYGDTTCELNFASYVGADEVSAIIKRIIVSFGEFIYAEQDCTLSERLFDLLRLRNVKVSVAESFTGGRVTKEIVKNSGVSSYFHEGIVCYSNESKKRRLGVREYDLESFGAVSAKVAYSMCAGLLSAGGCDLAISTTGLAGPNGDGTDKPVGLCYIGIGMKDGVHTYKFNFFGTREDITEKAKNTALFLAIKKLKKL